MARPARVRPGSGHPPLGGGRGAAVTRLRGGRPHVGGSAACRPHRGPLRRCARRRHGRDSCAGGRRVHRAPVRRGVRFRRGRPARGVPERGHLAVHAVHLHRSASAGVADRAPPRGQLADRAARRDRGARIASAGARSPVHRRPPLLFGLDSAVGDGTGGGRHRTGRGDAHQDLEHGAHRAPPAGAGKTAPGGQGGGAEESDQPALPLQHPRVDLVSHSHAARKPRGC